MSSHSKKSIHSRSSKSRARSPLAPRLSELRRDTTDRITKATSQTSPKSRQWAEKRQQAILDSAVASDAFHFRSYQPIAPPRRGFPETSVDPTSLTLDHKDPSTSLPEPPSITPDQLPALSAVGNQFRERRFSANRNVTQNMSAVEFMLPSFGHAMNPNYANYPPNYNPGSAYAQDEQNRIPQSSTAATSYATTYATSPGLISPSLRMRREPQEQQSEARQQRTSYSSYHSTAQSPYLTPASPAQGQYGFASTTAQFPTSQPPSLSAHNVASAAYSSSYSLPTQYASSGYDSGHQTVSAGSTYGSQGTSTWPPGTSYTVGSTADSSSGAQDNGVRIINSRPKPQCWDHGCNGRQFSTFSNLLRHQREKSGTAAKSVCPRCGAEFTRTTARNGHMAHDKCKRKSTTSSASGAE